MYKREELEKEIKLFRKNLHTFDRKFSAATPDLINVRINSFEKAFEAHTQQCTNYTMTAPDLVNVRVNALETALEAHTQQCTNTPTSPFAPGMQIHLHLTAQDTRLDDIDIDNQVIIDSLDNLHTKITENSNEEATHPDHLTDLNTSIAQTQERTDNIIQQVTDICAREKEVQQSTLDRITTSMTDFGQLANDTEQLMASIEPTALQRQNTMHTKTIATNTKLLIKCRKKHQHHKIRLGKQNRLV